MKFFIVSGGERKGLLHADGCADRAKWPRLAKGSNPKKMAKTGLATTAQWGRSAS